MTLNLLAIFCMLLLLYLAPKYGLMSTMVNLLLVASCLKLINIQSRSDFYLMFIVQFFLLACGFIYHQSLYMVIYYACCLFVLLSSAFFINRGNLSIKDSYKQSLKMILQVIPITILLFLVVPKLPPFWQVNLDKNTSTGLSEELSPGDIANLAQSEELVFRAEFTGALPAPEDRYWRTIVLDQFDGKTWRATPANQNRKSAHSYKDTLRISQDIYRYLIVAQPNDTKWLYSLDVPYIEESISPMSIDMNYRYQIFQDKPTDLASMYILRSFIDASLSDFMPKVDYAKYLQVPNNNSNLKTQKWINENLSEDLSFEEKINHLNRLFQDNNFIYTLKPPLMQNDPIDEFLFDQKQGFCSHYASAFTYMLRLANIPSRIVAGYQGGEEQGENIITVRQLDAHAWVEAYSETKGWVRFDPTAFVAPNRALSGLLSALSSEESYEIFERDASLIRSSLFEGLSESLEILDHKWSQFVLGFDSDAQSDLITKIFGQLNKRSLLTFLLLSLGIIAVMLLIIFIPYKQWFSLQRKSPLEKVLLSLSKKGLIRNKSETLLCFAERCCERLPQNTANMLKDFVDLYYAQRYEYMAFDQATYANEIEQANIEMRYLCKCLCRAISKLKFQSPNELNNADLV